MTMLPHSGTMLLEGAGYILATIFAVLIPIRIFESSGGGNLVARFGRDPAEHPRQLLGGCRSGAGGAL